MIEIPLSLLQQIHANGEAAYPEEGAGLLLGMVEGQLRRVRSILRFENAREDGARHNRYLISAQDMLRGEEEAAQRGLDVLGAYHSHPDHPNRPSDFDREWALPWFSYLITSVQAGKATDSRSWRLKEDRQAFEEETVFIIEISKEETLEE
jgi:proteasome lid subunit RPN8/RPN11